MANKKIIELDAASQVNSDAVFPLSQLVDSNQKTLKATVAQMQAAMLAPVSGLVTLGESSGSIASFSTDIADKLFSCYVNVTAVQSGSGTPAPDNVRAISGWSGANVTVCGKNLAYKKISNANINDQGSIIGNSPEFDLFIARVKSGVTYRATIDSAQNRYVYGFFSSEPAINSTSYNGQRYVEVNNYFTAPIDGFVAIRISTGFNNYMLELGNQATSYEPYNGTTHNIPFNTTVYGGVLDVLSGVLTVTHTGVNLGALTWTKQSTYNEFRAQIIANNLPIPKIVASSSLGDWICSALKSETGDNTYHGTVDKAISVNATYICATDSDCSDETALTTAMSGQYLVYELATPTVIQLTPTEVKTILGQNNIFGDCGDIDLKYLETIGNRL